jgi:hypothetical protein
MMSGSVAEVFRLPPIPQSANVIDALEQAFEKLASDTQYQAGVRVSVPGVECLYGLRVPMLREMAGQIVGVYSFSQNINGQGRRHCRAIVLSEYLNKTRTRRGKIPAMGAVPKGNP